MERSFPVASRLCLRYRLETIIKMLVFTSLFLAKILNYKLAHEGGIIFCKIRSLLYQQIKVLTIHIEFI